MSKELDDWLPAAMRAEVPERPTDFFDELDARLSGPATETTGFDVTVDRLTRPAAPRTRPPRWGRWTVVAAAAAVVVALALAVPALRGGDKRVDTGFVSQPEGTQFDLAQLEAIPGPAQNLDHWNAVYAVWDCTADDGAGAWLPPFQSTMDDVGIHSHGDGLISIHPFFEESAGRNATFSHFADAMNIEVSPEAIVLDDGRSLDAGTMCGGEPAVVQMRRWQSAADLERDPSIEPIRITADFGDQRFYNDLEVWTIALAPLDADLPLPPRERFDELARWWFPDLELLPPGVTIDAHPEGVPIEDGYTAVRRVGSTTEADDAVGELLEHQRDVTGGTLPLADAPLVPASAKHWIAASRNARVVAELFTYELVDETPGLEPTLSCWAVALPELGGVGTGGCTRSGDERVGETRTSADTFTIDADQRASLVKSVALWDAPGNAAWMIVHTTEGRRIVAEIVDGVSYAAWPNDDGRQDTISVLTADGDLVWGDDIP